MIVFDDDHSHAFFTAEDIAFTLKGHSFSAWTQTMFVAYFVNFFFQGIGEFPRVRDSRHPHRSLEDGGSPQVVERHTEI